MERSRSGSNMENSCTPCKNASSDSSSGKISSPFFFTLRIQDRWFNPKNSTYRSSSSTPRSCAMRNLVLLGASQIPMILSYPALRSACVTRPDGLVKLKIHASGAYFLISSQYSIRTGMVRTAMENPPTPVVSCPITPRSRAIVSSTTREWSPPTRNVVTI